jgi:hypothetical protein
MNLVEVLDGFAAKNREAETEAGSRKRLRIRQARMRLRLRRLVWYLKDPFLFPMLVFVALVALLYLFVGGR